MMKALLALLVVCGVSSAQSIEYGDAWGDHVDGSEAMHANGFYSLPNGYTITSAVMQWVNVNNVNDGGAVAMSAAGSVFSADSDDFGHIGNQPTAGQTYWVQCYLKYQWVVGGTLNTGTVTTGWTQAYASP